ncbi:MAG: hypothetical protein COU33_01580 [Candidatus Magasanikbacteria bacterium CG10_big_fil_rev_8_21_14_0_10_43_6]|uniref:Uncharacterized protein n=1 Tax=Candidatus Magasanikbacteria bacterium CG10_big_fil_rev_8_21_14_0_10_43_6 TaxID=1974650 RepID=A0A2M6W1N8_9BACT|nr:MAG: hypothetical protein COU33_01580 [Candidatus Magasanikbacteria bacterium CG10_big_fil_rev_8_21_14_0_10_43_6]
MSNMKKPLAYPPQFKFFFQKLELGDANGFWSPLFTMELPPLPLMSFLLPTTLVPDLNGQNK